MNNVVPLQTNTELVIMHGDLSKLSSDEKLNYMANVCKSMGLNPLTRPFDFISFQGKTVMYARKDCTDQLRKIHSVSITSMVPQIIDDLCIVTVEAKDSTGKEDRATGVVSIKGLSGEAKANALMKSESKAKRRVTLSICGLGILDESEPEDAKAGSLASVTPGVLSGPSTENLKAIVDLVGRFAKVAVSAKAICARYNVSDVAELTDTQVSELRSIGPQIANDSTKRLEFFPTNGSQS